MPNKQTGKSALGALRLQYLGGDDDWYSGASATISSPITVSGAFAAILKFADENSLSIVPEAQNMTKYDGNGVATVTLSHERMDVNTAGGGAPDYEVVRGQIRVINNSATVKSVTFAYVEKYDFLSGVVCESGELAAKGGQMYWEVASYVSPQDVFIANTVAGPDCHNIIDNGNGSYTINGADFFLQAIFPAST